MESTLRGKLAKLQAKLKAPKTQYNKFGQYNYRNCEDILEAVKPLLDEFELCLKLSDEPRELNGLIYINSRATIWDDEGTTIESEAQAFVDLTKKGMSPEQATGTASSYARKYALNGLLLIDDAKDVDSQDNRLSNASTANKSKGKTRLPNSGVEFDKVKAYLSKGGDLSAVKAKYTISKEVEQLLNK